MAPRRTSIASRHARASNSMTLSPAVGLMGTSIVTPRCIAVSSSGSRTLDRLIVTNRQGVPPKLMAWSIFILGGQSSFNISLPIGSVLQPPMVAAPQPGRNAPLARRLRRLFHAVHNGGRYVANGSPSALTVRVIAPLAGSIPVAVSGAETRRHLSRAVFSPRRANCRCRLGGAAFLFKHRLPSDLSRAMMLLIPHRSTTKMGRSVA